MAKTSDIAMVVAVLGGAYLLLGKLQETGKGIQDALSGPGGFGSGGININLGGTTLPVSIPQAASYTIPGVGTGFLTSDAAKFGAEQGIRARKTILDFFNMPFKTGFNIGQRMIGRTRSESFQPRMFTPKHPERFQPRRKFDEKDTRPGSIAMSALQRYRVNFGMGR